MPSRRWNDERPPIAPKRRVPTARQVEVFLAFVRLSNIQAVADELGIKPHTVHNQLSRLKATIGATDHANAAWILNDLLGDQLPGDWWRARYELHRRQSMTTTPGIDISSWQPTTPSLAGLGFVVPRATYGTRPDAKFPQHFAAGRKAGLVVPAYAFGTGVSLPEVQLAAFLAVASAADAYVLDLEAESGKTPMSLAQARAWIAGAKRTGKKVLLYHSEYHFPSLGQDGNWPAHWGVSAPTLASWALHQYRGSPLDLDHFNGSLAQLRAYFGKAAPRPVTYHLRFTGGAFWVYTTDGKPFTDSRGVRYGGTITGRRAQSFGAPTGAPCGPSAPYAWSKGTRYLARVKGGPLDRQLVAIHQSTVTFEVS